MGKIKKLCGYLFAFAVFGLPRLVVSVILAMLVMLPLQFLNFPFWVDTIIFIVICSTNLVGKLLGFILWIWSFVIVISNPIGGFSIFYLIVFAIYILTGVLPFVLSLISTPFDERE